MELYAGAARRLEERREAILVLDLAGLRFDRPSEAEHLDVELLDLNDRA